MIHKFDLHDEVYHKTGIEWRKMKIVGIREDYCGKIWYECIYKSNNQYAGKFVEDDLEYDLEYIKNRQHHS